MTIGFGRVVIDGVEQNDPYVHGLDKQGRFHVVSDSGGTYRVEQVPGSRPRRWRVFHDDPDDSRATGTVVEAGNPLARSYTFYREGHRFSSGWQNGFINAVFALIE